MEAMESEVPLKDGGNMVPAVRLSKLNEDTNNSDCGEESVDKPADLHNGGEQVDTSNDTKGDPKAKEKGNENIMKTARQKTGDSESSAEDGQDRHLLVDSANTSASVVGEDDEFEEFLGFDVGTASSEDPGALVLTKLIGHMESALECVKRDPYGASTSHDFEDLETGSGDDETEMKLAFCSSGTPSEIFIDYDAMDADDCESIKYSLKLISNVDVPRLKEGEMHEKNSGKKNADGIGSGGRVSGRNRSSKNLVKMKQKDKFVSGDGIGSETRKKRKKLMEEEVQGRDDVGSQLDTKPQMDVSLELSGIADTGWKRELVYRNASDSSKKMADIYYYSPSGRKVRSIREVLENLDSEDLTTENFTFFKEALGIDDPSKEVIRDAKKSPTKDQTATSTKKPTKVKQETVKPTALPEALSSSPRSESPKGSQHGRTAGPKTFPKIKRLPLTKLCGNKQKKNDNSEDGEMEIGMLPPMWSPNDSPFLKKAAGNSQTVTTVTWSSKNGSGKKSNNEPCSIRCVGVMGLIPSLQCRVCLCLYHPECVGLGTISETIHSYVCKNCQQEVKDGKSSASKVVNTSSPKLASSTTPPPLTPISALGVGNKTTASDTTSSQSATTSTSPPKLQRLPRMVESGKLITVPRFVKVPRSHESVLSPQQGQKGTAGNKGTIVGSVTTWLPPSSTIHLSPTGVAKTSSNAVSSSLSTISTTSTVNDPLTSPNPASVQSVAQMGGKKYIVVPKHNVLSVCPTMAAATATTPTSKSYVQVGDPSPVMDTAPITLSSSLVLTNATGCATTVLGSPQGLIGQPQVLMPCPTAATGGQTINLVQSTTPLTNFVASGGPVLPQPSAYLVSSGIPGGLQNPPGVLLVPFVGSGSTLIPTSSSGQDGLANKNSQQQQQPQYLIVNSPPGFQAGNFILGNLQQALRPTDVSAKAGDSADDTVDGQIRDAEDVSKEKRKLGGQDSDIPTTAKRLKSSSLETERRFMQCFMMNMCAGYSSLLHVFQYLKVQELLRAARVCHMWHDVASHPSLWRTVRMKNSHVGDWEGLVKSLCRHGTQHLDLRKMLVPNEGTSSMWDEFCHAIARATSLSRLDLCRCPAQVVERVAVSCPQLKIINALSIRCSNINLQCLGDQRNLQELRLKSVSGIHVTTTTTLAALKQLSSLKHLSLTTFKDLGKMEPSALGCLKNLESLELGECCDFPPEFGPESLARLKKLERLRLEKGQGKDCPTFSILAGIAALPKLTHLELVNFDVKPGFDKALAQCTNIRRLLIIPTYVTQSATTNHMVLNGVNQLCNSLTHFVWGVTHELLRVTELFVDQCEGQKDTKAPPSKSGKKSSGSDSIPILKPVQMNDCETEKSRDQESELDGNRNEDTKAAEDSDDKDESDDAKTSAAAPQVEILPLPKLQKLLTSSLPKTRVKILKIPFHATWRQTISEPAS